MTKGKAALVWGIVMFFLTVGVSGFSGAAYDINHDHGNIVGLHMGILIGCAAGLAVGALAAAWTYDVHD